MKEEKESKEKIKERNYTCVSELRKNDVPIKIVRLLKRVGFHAPHEVGAGGAERAHQGRQLSLELGSYSFTHLLLRASFLLIVVLLHL